MAASTKTCPKCSEPINDGATRCWNKGCDYVDSSKFTKCRVCEEDILIRTAEATGGFCHSSNCIGDCEAKKRAERQRVIVESRVTEGALKPCPLCGNLIRSSRYAKHTREKCERLPRPHPYATVLPHLPVPEWLERLASEGTLPPLIPLKDVLLDSCFYPSSGLDSSPVLLANGCVHSFVYVDYGTSRDDFNRTMYFPGFSPYRPILGRNVEKREIVPDNWLPHLPQRFDNPGFDGRQRLMEAQSRCHPFGHWSVWQRRKRLDERVGPRLFSFLFLGGEALASYQGLYSRNEITPKILAIIQPGHACGDNWTNFNDPHAPLWDAISYGAGLPEFLLLGSYGGGSISEDCPFPEYTFIRRTWTYEDSTERVIGIYKNSA